LQLWHGARDSLRFLTVWSLPARARKDAKELTFPEDGETSGRPLGESGPGGLVAFPIVGLLVGATSGLCATLGGLVFGPAGAGLGYVAGAALATGGLHVDGLADSADGLLAPCKTKLERLEIMKDSRVGSFGVMALLVVEGFKALAAARLWQLVFAHSLRTFFSYIAFTSIVGCITRGLAAVVVCTGTAAKSSGLAASLKPEKSDVVVVLVTSTSLIAAILGALLATALAGLSAPFWPVTAATAWATALGTWIAWHLWCRLRVGGYTGDTLGAGIELSETASLAAIAAIV
jgi:adenosylcobinamide-GDP ribazoletransferase